MRGLRESVSRGFWVAPRAPYGYRKVKVQDGPRERPKLELSPPADAVVRRIVEMALAGRSVLDISKTLNAEGIPSPGGKRWSKTTVHIDVRPTEWGGWGYRGSPTLMKRAAVVLRAGPGIRLDLHDGKVFVVTIDNPEIPARLLNTEASRLTTT